MNQFPTDEVKVDNVVDPTTKDERPPSQRSNGAPFDDRRTGRFSPTHRFPV